MNLFEKNKDGNNILIIAEKPSVGRSISRAISKKLKIRESKSDGYIKVDNFYITWAVGHLLELAVPEEYNSKYGTWSMDNHPIIVEDFIFKVPLDKNGTPKKYIAKQLTTIMTLAPMMEYYVIATDYDREGQIIGEEILTTINRKPTYRMLQNEWTYDEIISSLENSVSNDSEIPTKLKIEGFNRQRIDWLIGMNYSPMFSLAMAKTRNVQLTYNIGRVILPTLKLLYDRNDLVERSRNLEYFNIIQDITTDNGKSKVELVLKCGESKVVYGNSVDATVFKDSLRGYKYNVNIDNNIKNSYPKRLFSMTTLQQHIIRSRNYMSSKEISKIAQTLYEKGLITYPRTDSNYLEKSLFPKVCGILKSHTSGTKYEGIIKPHSSPRVFNNSLVKAHSAIIPTEKRLGKATGLDEKELLVYIEIVRRFLEQFSPAAIDSVSNVILNFKEDYLKEYNFSGEVKTELYSGWRALKSGDSIPIIDSSKLQTVNLNKVNTLYPRVEVDTSTRPYHFTETELLTSMINCGVNLINDNSEEIDKIMIKSLQGFSLGTSATRGDIVDKMIKTSYVEKVKNKLIITRKGKDVIEYFPNKFLLEPEYAGNIEHEISNADNFKPLENVKETIKEVSSQFKGIVYRKVIGYCPHCNNPIIIGKKAYGCMNSKGECSYHIPKNIEKIDISITDALEMLKIGEVKIKDHKIEYKCGIDGNKEIKITKLYKNV